MITSKERFLIAADGGSPDRPPVWLMRQAGRTLPEYRKLRERYSFWELCRTPELAARVTLQPLERFPLDAAVIFSDILVVPAVMGMDVGFSGGLSLRPPVRTAREVDNLRTGVCRDALGYVGDAIRITVKALAGKTAVLGFSGAPFTLAAYMVEGGGHKTFPEVRKLFYSSPETYRALLEKITAEVIDYLALQIEAGATAVQLFDTWAGELPGEMFAEAALRYVRRVIAAVRAMDVPVIYYINGCGNVLELMAESGATVLGIDWRISLSEALRRLGPVPLQGNLDPAVMLASPGVVRKHTRRLLRQTGGTGHIVNLGHGLLPETPVENIAAFVQAVQEPETKDGE